MEAKLSAMAAEPSLVTLHPAAMKRQLSSGNIGVLGSESAGALREFIAEIAVHATIAGRPLRIEVASRLALLPGAEAGRSGINGAGEGTRTPTTCVTGT